MNRQTNDLLLQKTPWNQKKYISDKAISFNTSHKCQYSSLCYWMYVLMLTWIDISSLLLYVERETPSVSQVSQFTLESTSLCAVSIQFELFSLIKKPSELDADVCGVRWQGNLIQEMRVKLNLWASKWQNMSVSCPCLKSLFKCMSQPTAVRLHLLY